MSKKKGRVLNSHIQCAPYLHLLYLQSHIVQLLFPSTELTDPLVWMQRAGLLHPCPRWRCYRFWKETVGLESCWHQPATTWPRSVLGITGSISPCNLLDLWQHLIMVSSCLSCPRARTEFLEPLERVSTQTIQKERLVKGAFNGRGIKLPSIFCSHMIRNRTPGLLKSIFPWSPIETQEIPVWQLRWLPSIKVSISHESCMFWSRSWHSSFGSTLQTALLSCRAQLGGWGTQRGWHNMGCWDGHLGFNGLEWGTVTGTAEVWGKDKPYFSYSPGNILTWTAILLLSNFPKNLKKQFFAPTPNSSMMKAHLCSHSLQVAGAGWQFPTTVNYRENPSLVHYTFLTDSS